MTTPFFILGAADPEMAAIEALLTECGVPFGYALSGGRRVHPGNAYAADGESTPSPAGALVSAVECGGVGIDTWNGCDHHRPGDYGYGRPPASFLDSSSIGQVVRRLARHCAELCFSGQRAEAGIPSFGAPYRAHSARELSMGQFIRSPSGEWEVVVIENDHLDASEGLLSMGWVQRVPVDILHVAAADHCLAAAYRGECPGVDPDALMQWRAQSRADFQRRPVGEVLADIEAATEGLREATRCTECGDRRDWSPEGMARNLGVSDCGVIGGLGGCGDCHRWTADMGGDTVPELPEAAVRIGVAYVATTADRDGRRKRVLGGHTTPEQIATWMATCGLRDVYGDPARGFAGAYVD